MSVGGVLGFEDRRRASFADFTLQGVAGDDLADEIFAGHAANLMAPSGRGKRRKSRLARAFFSATLSRRKSRPSDEITRPVR